jgi:ribosomal protein L37AE/L43A
MRDHKAFVDEMAIAGEFCTGDVVRKTGLRDFLLSPYVGRVVYSNTRTGKVTVQWPWGAEQESPVELVKDSSGDFVPPLLTNQYYSSYESEYHICSEQKDKEADKWRKTLASRIVDKYETLTMPIWRAACKAWHNNISQIDAFYKLSNIFAEKFGTDTVRRTVSNLYGSGERLAIYYKDNKRRYRVTNKEKSSGRLMCPRCKSYLKPRTYRQGKRVFLCKQCGFTISPKDLIYPGVEPTQKIVDTTE